MSLSADPASMLISAAVPAFKCPPGTKMYILDLGTLQLDESWFVELPSDITVSYSWNLAFTNILIQDSSWWQH